MKILNCFVYEYIIIALLIKFLCISGNLNERLWVTFLL